MELRRDGQAESELFPLGSNPEEHGPVQVPKLLVVGRKLFFERKRKESGEEYSPAFALKLPGFVLRRR